MLHMSEAALHADQPILRRLPPEPWGRRLRRAREDVAGYTLAEAVGLAGRFVLVTDSTISRLEAMEVQPSGPRAGGRRQLAYILSVAYGVDPAEFGLSPDDLPPGLSIPPRSRGDDGSVLSTKWYTGNPSVRHLRIAA